MNEPSEGIPPEQRLFRAIIANAALEATGRIAISSTRSSRQFTETRADAIRWFRDADADFQRVCSLAGLEPGYVRRRVLSFIAVPEATASRNMGGGRRSGVTAAAIAARAGVSPSTVANVRRGKSSVAPAIRRRVLAAIAELTEPQESNPGVH